MNTLVIDASIAVKWVVEENGTPEALVLRQKAKLIAPELLVAECANILWKKVQRDELLKEEALLAARLLQGVRSNCCPRGLCLRPRRKCQSKSTTPLMIALYLALAVDNECRCVTADERFLRNFIRAESTGFVPERFR